MISMGSRVEKQAGGMDGAAHHPWISQSMEACMERHDDTEQHDGARGEEASSNDYPRGRGYGQDYMRGGEVFGGYGYSERPDYARPLAEQHRDERASSQADGEPGAETPPEDDRQFGRESEEIEGTPRPATSDPPGGASDRSSDAHADAEESSRIPPVPQVEGCFGSEGPRNYSRSYYVTQAQLQQRLFRHPGERHPPGPRVDVEE